MVTLDKFLADGEPDASALILFLVVQSLEDAENLLGKLRIDANSIVPNTKPPEVILNLWLSAELHPWSDGDKSFVGNFGLSAVNYRVAQFVWVPEKSGKFRDFGAAPHPHRVFLYIAVQPIVVCN